MNLHSISSINYEFSLKLVLQLLFLFVVVMLGLRIPTVGYYILGICALAIAGGRKVENMFLLLLLLIGLGTVNPVFFRKGVEFYAVTRIAVALVAVLAINAASGRRSFVTAPFNYLIIYAFVAALTSLWGWSPVISMMKVALFLVFLLAMVKGTEMVVIRGVDIRFVRAGMLALCSFFILGSLAVIPFPSIGMSMMEAKLARWNVDIQQVDVYGLFNGVTWHSQTLGPLLAMLNTFLLSDYLCGFRRPSWLYRILLAGIPPLVYMTSSRTAFFAYLMSIISVVFFFQREHHVSGSKRQRVLMSFMIASFVAVIVVAFHPRTSERLEAFLRKSRSGEVGQYTTDLTESLFASREGLIQRGWKRFQESPWIGNGFQVSPEMRGYNIFEHGFIFSAPIEKGFMWTMILEEGGVLGMAIFAVFIFSLYTNYMRMQFTCFLSTFTVFLALNSGEASIFSTSGGGGIFWLVCFCALLMDVHRHRVRVAEMLRADTLHATYQQ